MFSPRLRPPWHISFKLRTLALVFFSVLIMAACTTLKERNRIILNDHKSIKWQDGITSEEALYIIKHYMHVENSYYGVRYFYALIPDELVDSWQFMTTYRNSSYERNPQQQLILFVNKINGKVSTKTIDHGISQHKKQILTERFENVNKEDGISRSESIDIVKHHMYVQTNNQYWMYKIMFNPTESKRYWIYELSLQSEIIINGKNVGKNLQKLEGLFLAVNKKTGELIKERSYFQLVK